MIDKSEKPDFLFEISWEICNKVGGIYTVLSTKSNVLYDVFNDNQIYIGPDVWMETTKTPDFEEDSDLYKTWTTVAAQEGLHFRIGRWKVPSNPLVILVDFTQYFSEKNNIFATFWEKYKLDSISGQWDYIEPAMFGYAAAKVIESFYKFNVSANDKIIAHFHEWMSGMGILYIKDKLPQIATIFTTHATILGRSIASNGMALYQELSSPYFSAEETAKKYNLGSKFSLEKLSIELCDVFTTVSEITSNECKIIYNRTADVITPNGFDKILSPSFEDCNKKRQKAREKLLNVANAMFDKNFDDKTLIIITSGRYEFRNKGIDILLDVMSDIKIDGDILLYLFIPANSISPVKELKEKLNGNNFASISDRILTHNIHNEDDDIIVKTCKEKHLDNSIHSKIKVLFVPVYLDGKDGIFDTHYYNLLPGADLSIFASYYEPWGYTPLESIAFAVPTITSNLSGFGQWINTYHKDKKSVFVVQRNDSNYDESKQIIENYIVNFANNNSYDSIRSEAFSLSDSFLWTYLINNYFTAYKYAIKSSLARKDFYVKKIPSFDTNNIVIAESSPIWRKVFVKQVMPEALNSLKKLSMNLWWSWNPEAEELFESINPQSWEDYQHNPIALLESLSAECLKNLENNKDFTDKLHKVYSNFEAYMNVVKDKNHPSIAYFSMEYGIHNSLKIFSGGLGMLAGDYLKEMSDRNIDIIGIGLLYRYGYFNQSINHEGEQVSSTNPQRFTHLPIIPVRDNDGNILKVKIALPARNINAKIWHVNVGRVSLYLLDTDIDENWEIDRVVTHQLYGGDNETRLKQELLLGVGGIRLLRLLNINPNIYHINEGHAAFAGLERLREYVQKQNLRFNEAVEIVRASTLFTTHTPVPAGHDYFSEDLLRAYIPHYPDRMSISWNDMINMGKVKADSNEKFSMSILAINLSQEVNGVSKIHGRITREMFLEMFPGYNANELYISHVTNGVHYPSWVAKEWRELHVKAFGESFLTDQANQELWKKIYDVDDEKIWAIRNALRNKMVDYIKARIPHEMKERQESPSLILQTLEELRGNKLTICFARRFATYKRAHLLFENLERLKNIVNSCERPVQFIFSGKAHPADKAGQELIKNIINISRIPEFIGKIIFIENYDIEVAKNLIQGADIWLNTPTRPLEASGTSGEKAIMNGVLNFSVLDGWWAEGYKEGAGWALKEERTYTNQKYQDILDSETLYHKLENEIIPLFYERKNNIPHSWIKYIKNNFYMISPHYTMKRMTDDYLYIQYPKLNKRTISFINSNYQKAKDYAAWKEKMIKYWDYIKVLSIDFPESNIKTYKVGENFSVSISLKLFCISSDDIAVELIIGRKENNRKMPFMEILPMNICKKSGSVYEFRLDKIIETPGIVDVSIRIRPNNIEMPYPQDLKLIKWV